MPLRFKCRTFYAYKIQTENKVCFVTIQEFWFETYMLHTFSMKTPLTRRKRCQDKFYGIRYDTVSVRQVYGTIRYTVSSPSAFNVDTGNGVGSLSSQAGGMSEIFARKRVFPLDAHARKFLNSFVPLAPARVAGASLNTMIFILYF